MASSSKGQGLQIALIVFVVLTVAMSVTWFIFYQKATELGTKLVAAEDVKKKADTDKATAIRQLGTLKAKIGYPDAEFGNDSPPDAPGGATVMSKVAEDLQKYAPKDQAADPNPTYTARLAGLQRVLDNTEQQLTALTQKYQTLQAEFDKQRSVEAAKIAEHDAAMQAANTDRDRVEKDTGAQMAALLLEQQAALTQSQLQTTKAEQSRSDLEKAKTTHDKKESLLVSEVNQLKENVSRTQSMGHPVATVLSVDNANKEVYIDVGDQDGLPKRTMFSIWDASKVATPHWKARDEKIKETAAEEFSESKTDLKARPEGGPKAYIEIVDIRGPHMAVGRITMSTIYDPITPGDKVYGIWSPDDHKHFALAGRFDLTGKGSNDRALLKEIIKRHGGVIDAEVLDDGTTQGEIQVGTDYFVVGLLSEPGDSNDAEAPHAEAVRNATAKVRAEAKKLAVDIVDLNKLDDFYGYIGYKPNSRQYELGNYTGQPNNFKQFENPTNTSRPKGLPSFENPAASSRPSSLPGRSNSRKP